MATNTTTTHLKFLTQPVKLTHRRRYRETTITTSPCSPTPSTAAASNSSSAVAPPLNQIQHHSHKLGNPSVVSPDNTSWPCPNSKPLDHSSSTSTSSPIVAQSTFLSRVTSSMDSPAPNHDSLPSSFSKFNSALTAGLLNPMSPPPAIDKTRSSPTLFEMMVNEPDCHPRAVGMTTTTTTQIPNAVFTVQNMKPVDKQTLMYQRLMDILVCKSPGNLFNDSGSGDVKLTLSSKDGVSISISVHRQILVVHSRFFAEKLSERWAKQQRNMGPYIVEIADCDDIEVYLETLKLMYCKDLKKKLMKEDVSKVLGILKVSTAIGYDAGVLSCLEFLEAAPWAEDEEEKVASLLSELQLEGNGAGEVLKRVSLDASAGVSDKPENEEVLLKLLHVVLEGKDEKARREMKVLVSKMLHESSSHADLRKESLYSACDGCLKLLRRSFLKTADGDLLDASQISRQADNLHWILDILIDRMIAEDFLKTWASLSELSEVHSRVPVIHRYEVSRVTSRLFVAIGKGLLLASKESRCLLLQTWLVPFYEDFGWMSRATKGLDRHVIEEGLSNTILTLPMAWQQEILMSWFDRFLNSGDDCPNIQRGFEVWWRRAFWKRNVDHERPCQMQIINGTDGN